MQGHILVLSGPSGSGKSTLCNALKENFTNLFFSISTTTRLPRINEKNGREYFFTSKEEFLADIRENKFLEWAKVHNNYYGTSRIPVEKALEEGKLVVFDIDVQGHKNIRQYYPKLTKSIFITTPNDLVLKSRLKQRNTDTEEIIQTRIKNAYQEMLSIDEFDYLIINDNIEESIRKILAIAHTLPCTRFDAKSICAKWKTIEK